LQRRSPRLEDAYLRRTGCAPQRTQEPKAEVDHPKGALFLILVYLLGVILPMMRTIT
jgi:hypothetical protein